MAIHFLSAVDGWQHGRHFLGLEKKRRFLILMRIRRMSPTDGRCTTSTDLDEMAAPHHFRIGARELPFFFSSFFFVFLSFFFFFFFFFFFLVATSAVAQLDRNGRSIVSKAKKKRKEKENETKEKLQGSIRHLPF